MNRRAAIPAPVPGRAAAAWPGDNRIPANLRLGLALTGFVLALALVGLVWTPHDVAAQNIAGRLQYPSGAHWLGTDIYGRDILSRLMVGAGNSLLVAVASVAVGLFAGVPLGLAAAALPGAPDRSLSGLTSLVFAFPAVVTATLAAALLGPGAGNAVLAIGIFNIAVFARVTRGGAVAVWRRDFTRAALALGRGPLGVSVHHVLPNVAGLLAVQATIQLAVAVLAEAGLNYLGFGVQPPAPSLGRMLQEAQSFLFVAPRLAVWPGLAIAVMVLGLNLLGDALRDRLDPKGRTVRAAGG